MTDAALRDGLRELLRATDVDDVARAVGVNVRTLYAWLNGKSEPWRAARVALEVLLRERKAPAGDREVRGRV